MEFLKMTAMGKADVLSDIDVRNVLNAVAQTRFPERNRIMFLLSIYAGLRVCNIQRIQIADVYDSNGNPFDKIVLDRTKTKGNRVYECYLSNDLKTELKKYYKFLLSKHTTLKPTDYLIYSQKLSNNPLTKESINRVFREVYDSVGLFQCRSHSGRRTFITKLCDKGVAIQLVSKLVNHTSVNTTLSYYQQSPTLLKNAVNVLEL